MCEKEPTQFEQGTAACHDFFVIYRDSADTGKQGDRYFTTNISAGVHLRFEVDRYIPNIVHLENTTADTTNTTQILLVVDDLDDTLGTDVCVLREVGNELRF